MALRDILVEFKQAALEKQKYEAAKPDRRKRYTEAFEELCSKFEMDLVGLVSENLIKVVPRVRNCTSPDFGDYSIKTLRFETFGRYAELVPLNEIVTGHRGCAVLQRVDVPARRVVHILLDGRSDVVQWNFKKTDLPDAYKETPTRQMDALSYPVDSETIGVALERVLDYLPILGS